MIHVFIINHFAGAKDYTKNLRKHLAAKEGLRYFVFNTISAGFETEIVKKMCKYFSDDKLRFYCCGGSGTFRNMMEGVDCLENVEFAFYPCGLTNDFLKCFGDITVFRDIDALIEGKVEKIDYIKTNYGVALNTLSVGFDSNVAHYMDYYRVYNILSNQLPYIMSVFKGIIFVKPRMVELEIDGDGKAHKCAQIVYGNGCVLGGNMYFVNHVVVNDGVVAYLKVSNFNPWEAFHIILSLMQKRVDKIRSRKVMHGECQTIVIRSIDGKPLWLNFDGELVECGTECKAEIIKQGLNFVVPKQIEIKEFRVN